MTDEDNIIQLFHSGQYELAYTLRESLNVEMDYSKIDLAGMVGKLGRESTLFIPNKNNVLTVEIEINNYYKDLDWIDLVHYDFEFLCTQLAILRNEFNAIPRARNHDNYDGITFFFYEENLDKKTVPKLLKYIFEYE